MTIMKKMLNEYYPETANAVESYHQSRMNHHSAHAMQCSRQARDYQSRAEGVDDDMKGQFNELARAYGTAAKAHLTIADHHTALFKKERTDTVKQMLEKPKNPSTIVNKSRIVK